MFGNQLILMGRVLSRSIFSVLGCYTVVFFGPFLGAERTAIMTTGKNLVLFGILIFLLIILFRRINSKIKYGFLKGFTISFLSLRFPFFEISQPKWGGPQSERSLFLYVENRIYSKEMFRPAGEASYFPTD